MYRNTYKYPSRYKITQVRERAIQPVEKIGPLKDSSSGDIRLARRCAFRASFYNTVVVHNCDHVNRENKNTLFIRTYIHLYVCTNEQGICSRGYTYSLVLNTDIAYGESCPSRRGLCNAEQIPVPPPSGSDVIGAHYLDRKILLALLPVFRIPWVIFRFHIAYYN